MIANRFKIAPFAIAVTALNACAAPEASKSGTRVMPAEQCRQQPGQAFVGQTASAETGQKMLAATHARQLRWVPPRSAVTMDFRYDRLTVGYDDSMIITSVNCN